MQELYPLKFRPILKERIWGGNRLETLLRKDVRDIASCGESWELSSVDGDVSVVANGGLAGKSLTELIATYGSELVGAEVLRRFGTEFPILIKFLDSAQDLSVQVHPDDEMAKRRGLGMGKTEMWYVIDAEADAQLVSGFNAPLSPDQYESRLADGTFMETLRHNNVGHGDAFYIPSGRIHALGKGCLVAEIQQTSDTTFRVYDYDRTDARGNKRELHVELAKEALLFDDTESGRCNYTPKENGVALIKDSQHFVVSLVKTLRSVSRDYSSCNGAVILICVKGAIKVCGVDVSFGETCLLPASMTKSEVVIETEVDTEVLEVYIP